MSLCSNNDKIRKVVVIQLENRSFEHLFATHPKVLKGKAFKPKTCYDSKGKPFQQVPVPKDHGAINTSYAHDYDSCTLQAENNNGGFVRSVERQFDILDDQDNSSTDEDKQQSMMYYPNNSLPVFQYLADNFVLCDKWFSSVASCTWTNRAMSLAGTSNGVRVMMNDITESAPISDYLMENQTIFTLLEDKGINWNCYYHEFALSLLFRKHWSPRIFENFVKFDQFFNDAKKSPDEFPTFSWIEPSYYGKYANDAHAPHELQNTERLIAQVYNALQQNPALFEQTLLIITFDEHDGLYDSVPPPYAEYPDHVSKKHPQFGRLGFRVPSILISPWLPSKLDSTVYDHTSVLAYMINKFDLPDVLGNRVRTANYFDKLFEIHGLSQPRKMYPIEVPDPLENTFDGEIATDLALVAMKALGNIMSALGGINRGLLNTVESITHHLFHFKKAKNQKLASNVLILGILMLFIGLFLILVSKIIHTLHTTKKGTLIITNFEKIENDNIIPLSSTRSSSNAA